MERHCGAMQNTMGGWMDPTDEVMFFCATDDDGERRGNT